MLKEKKEILAVLVNFGDEQLEYLQQVVNELKTFKKYNVTIIVQSNIKIDIEGINEVNILTLEDYQLLPLTCRKVIWENRNDYDIFLYGENDLLFREKHIDNYLEYYKILPKNRISGLLRFEIEEGNNFYPDYHLDFEWDFKSVETYEGKVFAYFNNTHQATFILNREQLFAVGKKIDFEVLVPNSSSFLINRFLRKIKKTLGIRLERQNKYSVKCKVNTDIYDYGGMKKMICISEFEDNLIHHLPNIYIDGLKGRNKFRSDSERMNEALNKLLKK